MISVQNIYKSFGNREILSNISFNINPKERIGFIGRNGHGKTTLLKIITKEIQPDSGSIIIPRDYKIAYLTQHLVFSKKTILEEVKLALKNNLFENEWKVKKILFGLGFSEDDILKPPSFFSGGFQIRINLAKILATEPNLLLLDEPTNFLDIVSIRWLLNLLRNWGQELLIVSHDRNLIDKVCSHIIGIYRNKGKKIKGNTSTYYEQIYKEDEIFEKNRLNQEKKAKQMENFITKFRAKARQASMAQSRIKALQKQTIQSKLDNITTLKFSFNEQTFNAKYLIECFDLSFSYLPMNKNNLIQNLSFHAEKGFKICIVGKNGKGKSTLLKLLNSSLNPTKGYIKYHPKTDIGYFEQGNTAHLDNNNTIENEILLSLNNEDIKKARDICGAMMFKGDDALKMIEVLSGGERSRVMLGKLLAKSSNLLLLDEPTHHMDMESCEALALAINNFKGAVIMVTHNEWILEKVATHFIVFDKNKTFFFHGNYNDLLKKINWDNDDITQNHTKPPKEKSKIFSRKEQKQLKADFIKRRSTVLTPLKKDISNIEERISSLETQLEKTNNNLLKASEEGDRKNIKDYSIKLQETNTNINNAYEELDKLYTQFDTQNKNFSKEEKNL